MFWIAGDPLPKVTWWQSGSLFDSSDEVTRTGVILNRMVYKSLTRKDLGKTFTCQAANTNLTMPVSSEVKIIINCKYEYGNAYFIIYWHKSIQCIAYDCNLTTKLVKLQSLKNTISRLTNVAVYVFFKTNKFPLNIWLCVRASLCGILLNNYVCMSKRTRIWWDLHLICVVCWNNKSSTFVDYFIVIYRIWSRVIDHACFVQPSEKPND